MRKSLDIKIVRHGKILYHAIKSNYVTNYKCVLNIISNTYELRTLIQNTSKMNWSKEPLIIPTKNLDRILHGRKAMMIILLMLLKVQFHLNKLLLRIPRNDYTTINILRVL